MSAALTRSLQSLSLLLNGKARKAYIRRAPIDKAKADRAIFLRLYDFSKEHPQYFALMFLERSVPRISHEYERFAFAREVKRHLMEEVERCIQTSALPSTTRPYVAVRMMTMAILGVASMRLSERLGPNEDADSLARDVIEVVLAGLQSGVALRSTGDWECPAEAPEASTDERAS